MKRFDDLHILASSRHRYRIIGIQKFAARRLRRE
jgi:hypothetical protein